MALLQLGRMLAAGSAMLILACNSTPSPTAANTVAAPPAPSMAAAIQAPSSIVVHGLVVDSSNRPLAGMMVECMGDHLQCAPRHYDISAEDGPDQGARTDSSGAYSMVASRSGGAEGGFLMNASGRGYEITWHEVAFPEPACTSDRPGCSVTVNFTLAPQAE